MRYMLLIHFNEAEVAKASQPEYTTIAAEYAAFHKPWPRRASASPANAFSRARPPRASG